MLKKKKMLSHQESKPGVNLNWIHLARMILKLEEKNEMDDDEIETGKIVKKERTHEVNQVNVVNSGFRNDVKNEQNKMSEMNISDFEWKGLKSENEFCDVTIACDDKQKTTQKLVIFDEIYYEENSCQNYEGAYDNEHNDITVKYEYDETDLLGKSENFNSCDKCTKNFGIKFDLDLHVKMYHEGICQSYEYSKSDLLEIEYFEKEDYFIFKGKGGCNSLDEENILCEHCEKRFRSGKSPKSHVETAHEQPGASLLTRSPFCCSRLLDYSHSSVTIELKKLVNKLVLCCNRVKFAFKYQRGIIFCISLRRKLVKR